MDWRQVAFAIFSAIAVALGVGVYLPWARAAGWGQRVRVDGPSAHLEKEGTVTGAGVVFFLPILAGAVWVVLENGTDLMVPILAVFAFGVLGWLDDWLKIQSGTRGLQARYRFILQGLIGLELGIWAFSQFGGIVHLPFMSSPLDLGFGRVVLDMFVVWGLANGVNFTDGLDGLLAGVWALFGVGIAGMALAVGTSVAQPLIWAGVGASAGFLLWNAHPARAFMGEVGSSLLAGLAAVATLSAGMEIGLLIVGLIFAVEVLSVIVQVATYRTLKRRILKMSPLHHHFELSGIPEERVTTGFWLVQTGLSLGGLMAYV